MNYVREEKNHHVGVKGNRLLSVKPASKWTGVCQHPVKQWISALQTGRLYR